MIDLLRGENLANIVQKVLLGSTKKKPSDKPLGSCNRLFQYGASLKF